MALLALPFVACVDNAPPSQPDEPSPLGERVARALADHGHVPVHPDGLEFNIFNLDEAELNGNVTPESCDAVDQALAPICNELYADGNVQGCGYDTAFFYANDIPRCAVRFHTFSDDNWYISPMHVLDFSGEPVGDVPTCGNGVLDPGEECDDGNFELWDGCDSHCAAEPFNGCEAVIQDYYQQAGLAMVDQAAWEGPRSHLMVNRQAIALREVTPATCDAAIATASDVCTELGQQMPFVSWCQAGGLYHETGGDPACSIRLQVYFHTRDAGAGVYTTSLPGILAFTIR